MHKTLIFFHINKGILESQNPFISKWPAQNILFPYYYYYYHQYQTITHHILGQYHWIIEGVTTQHCLSCFCRRLRGTSPHGTSAVGSIKFKTSLSTITSLHFPAPPPPPPGGLPQLKLLFFIHSHVINHVVVFLRRPIKKRCVRSKVFFFSYETALLIN